MLTDIEIKRKGLKILIENFGDLETEKFISLIIKEPFDYKKGQSTLWRDQSFKKVS